MNPRTCVVIPFYQREPGPLARALASVRAQTGVACPQVIVVDDGSPLPARPIIAAHFGPCNDIQVIEQANAGAAAARNTGLDACPDDVAFIAFLDSDDEWSPAHLANAQDAMSLGADMYFADHQRPEWPTGKLAGLTAVLASQPRAESGAGLYELAGNVAELIFIQHIIQTSSVVLRRAAVEDLRFRRDLILGEDEVYWLEAARRSRKVLFSTRLDVRMGQGVNISQNLAGDPARELRLTAKNIYFWNRVLGYLPGEVGLAAIRSSRLELLDQGYAATLLAAIRQRNAPSLTEVWDVTRQRPQWIGAAVGLILQKAVGALTSVRR